MPFLSAHHFIAARGLDAFLTFLEMCREHRTIVELGARFSISASMAARYRKRFCSVQYSIKPAVAEAIRFHLESADDARADLAARLELMQSSTASRDAAAGPVLLR